VSDSQLKRRIGFVAVLNLAIIAIIAGRPYFSNASRPILGITNPVLAMEVVRDVPEADAILGDAPSPDREVMRIKQFIDFAFIAGYAALFVLMSLLLRPQGPGLAIVAAALGVLAAIFDIAENLGILRVLDVDLSHTTQAMLNAILYPSLLKWTLASLALGLMGALAWRTGRVGLRIVGALDVLAALLGFCGLYQNRMLQWQGPAMAGGLVGLAILFFRPYYRNTRRT
jgi:hypothetical protein